MSWETRSGKSYYYRKVRRDGKVVSEYRGGGAQGNLAERADLVAAGKRATARSDLETDERVVREMEQLADEVEFVVTTLTRAWLLALGYRMHKGQWRLKRVKANDSGAPTAEGLERKKDSRIR